MIWVGIGLAVTGWLIGLLLETGLVVHLLLVGAGVLLAIQVVRQRRAAES